MIAELEQEKFISPNKLPFLQSQILQILYLNIFFEKENSLEEIAEVTGYNMESKILRDAIKSLLTKYFLNGDFENGFSIPSYRIELFEFVVKKNDYVHKSYSENILSLKYINRKIKNNQISLFNTNANISNSAISSYNKSGLCHRWYDYLEDFPYYLIEEKIKEYELNEKSIIVEPFSGSGTTNVSSKMFGIKSFGFDANPLMTFISEVKTTWDIDISILKNEIYNTSIKFLKSIHDFDILKIDTDFVL